MSESKMSASKMSVRPSVRHQQSSLITHLVRAAFAAGVVMTLTGGIASAGDVVSSDKILQALTPKPLTRSLSAAPADNANTAATNQFVATVKNRPTRSLSSGERDQIYAIAQTRPNIDLEINFDYNSANISKSALAQVDALGKALSDPALKGTTFAVAGHTDAVGSDSYNQDLSERRAESVKKYLTTKYGLAAGDLVTVGYGKTKLKDPSDPKGAENRRVQVVNMASKVAGN